MKKEKNIKEEGSKECNNDNDNDNNNNEEDNEIVKQEELRRGPWTPEEDTLLIHYVASHGEGRWNLLAKSAGLKRTGKSCRLRWLNYLKPDIKRGNLSPEEQLLILELHSKWGNRWSKIASQLPGRTDNEIKNYWRTRVQKQAKQLNMESNSQSFIDAIRCYYMPRLVEKIEQNSKVNSSEVSPFSIIETSPSKLDDTPSSNTSLSSNIPEILEQNNVDEFFSLNTCEYDMDLDATSAPDISFSVCHAAVDNWLGDDVAGDDSLWDFGGLWQFRK